MRPCPSRPIVTRCTGDPNVCTPNSSLVSTSVSEHHRHDAFLGIDVGAVVHCDDRSGSSNDGRHPRHGGRRHIEFRHSGSDHQRLPRPRAKSDRMHQFQPTSGLRSSADEPRGPGRLAATRAVRSDDGRGLRDFLARRTSSSSTRHPGSGGLRTFDVVERRAPSTDHTEPAARTSRPGRAPVGSPSANVCTPATNVAR